MEIVKGVTFDTPFETGCVALEPPNSHGSFLALDSDGVECHFHIAMVEQTHGPLTNDDVNAWSDGIARVLSDPPPIGH